MRNAQGPGHLSHPEPWRNWHSSSHIWDLPSEALLWTALIIRKTEEDSEGRMEASIRESTSWGDCPRSWGRNTVESRQEATFKPFFISYIQWQTRDPASNKLEGEDPPARLSSDLHMCIVAHLYLHSHTNILSYAYRKTNSSVENLINSMDHGDNRIAGLEEKVEELVHLVKHNDKF